MAKYQSAEWDENTGTCNLHGNQIPCQICIDDHNSDVRIIYDENTDKEKPGNQELNINANQ